ncbi:hypothetical protein FSP39_002710 [Pinctada imbricata]|uniref:Protein THEM6 n=1 Tax=Pinctada imbricata TaxID=66713 RepID=A0AA88YH27_PINIB|nr:hypothetical protein FSP39_002710 [Pinctada imbricata]
MAFNDISHKCSIGPKGICLTTDLDNLWHMNNSRYLRECDFGRMKLFLMTSVWKAVTKCGGSFVNAGNNIRYRKSIELLDRYIIRSKIIYWDEKAFYVNQHFIRARDNFICAVNIAKMATIGTTPANIIRTLEGRDIPPPTPGPELIKLMESWQLSSENLRKNS